MNRYIAVFNSTQYVEYRVMVASDLFQINQTERATSIMRYHSTDELCQWCFNCVTENAQRVHTISSMQFLRTNI